LILKIIRVFVSTTVITVRRPYLYVRDWDETEAFQFSNCQDRDVLKLRLETTSLSICIKLLVLLFHFNTATIRRPSYFKLLMCKFMPRAYGGFKNQPNSSSQAWYGNSSLNNSGFNLSREQSSSPYHSYKIHLKYVTM